MKNPFESFDTPTVEKAYGAAKKLLDKDAVSMESFVDTYGKDVVAEDMALAGKLRARYSEAQGGVSKHEREIHMLATVFEAIVHEHGELSEWLGPSATTIRVSDFDDLINGVDEIVEFEENEHSARHLALAIDLTTGADMRKKIHRITSEIDSGQLAEIKYFESEHLDFKGKKLNVPRAVIGADIGTVRELTELWLNKKTSELANHPIAAQILEELLLQARGFGAYAEESGQEKATATYKKLEQSILQIFKEKGLVPGNAVENLKQDSVFYSLHGHMEHLSSRSTK